MRKKVVLLCGLIGSGKTTYASNHYQYFTDLDYMNPYARKKDQIEWTLRLLKKANKVCHITTYPTEEELEAFLKFETELLCMDTSINQCKTNILIRNRKRDLDNIQNTFEANEKLVKKIKSSHLKFEFINVFD